MKRILSIVFVVAVIFTMAAPVFAQGGSEAKSGVNFPAGDTLTIIVPVSAGAGMDTQAKLMQKYIEKYLGKTVIIENIAGGATTLAAQDYLSREKNDDSIIMLSTDHRVFSPILQKADYSYESFVSLSANNFTEEYFWVNVDSPFQTWDDVVAASKEKPVIFGTGAKSGPVYIATRQLVSSQVSQWRTLSPTASRRALQTCSADTLTSHGQAIPQQETTISQERSARSSEQVLRFSQAITVSSASRLSRAWVMISHSAHVTHSACALTRIRRLSIT